MQSRSGTAVQSTDTGLPGGWRLFWWIAVPLNLAMLVATLSHDLSKPEDVSAMIQYSVRWSVPFICLVTAAAALPALFPAPWSRWVLRNRRYLGLLFALAMAWQGAFIFLMSAGHGDYYYRDVYLLRDELEGSSGYVLLAFMVITSFRFGRRHLSAAQWKTLHRAGVYFLWAYPFSVYWWNLFYYGQPVMLDVLYYALCFGAFALRIAAWGKRRRAVAPPPSAARNALGWMLVAGAGVAAVTGHLWQAPVSGWLTAPMWSARLELWLPFWPFEPFLPLALLGVAAWVLGGNAGEAAAAAR